MSELQRYEIGGGWTNPNSQGEWVRHSDAQAVIEAAVEERDAEIARLKSRLEAEVGGLDPRLVHRTDVATMKSLAQRAEQAEQHQISGFYEEKYPIYSQGAPIMELQSLATAEECNGLVQRIRDLEAALRSITLSVAERDAKYAGMSAADIARQVLAAQTPKEKP